MYPFFVQLMSLCPISILDSFPTQQTSSVEEPPSEQGSSYLASLVAKCEELCHARHPTIKQSFT